MIKIFSDSNTFKVEDDVNAFLSDNPRYRIVYSKYTHDKHKSYNCNLTIILERR